MAGEWLKMEACTPEKSEVLAITARMGWDDSDLTVGKLFRIWRWFDQQTTDGNACGVTVALLDRIVGVSGFCNAMQSFGWLTITDSGVSLPNFDRHNGNTAKNRALTAKRVANHKANSKGNGQGNADTVSDALPREEKRRKENSSTNVEEKSASAQRGKPASVAQPEDVSESVWQDFLAVRKAKRAPLTETALDNLRREAGKAGMTLQAVLAMCCARGWSGFNASWEGVKNFTNPVNQTSETQYQRAARERAAEWSPSIAKGAPVPERQLGQVIEGDVVELKTNLLGAA